MDRGLIHHWRLALFLFFCGEIHLKEYLVNALFNEPDLTYRSFLFDTSHILNIVKIYGFIEYIVQSYFGQGQTFSGNLTTGIGLIMLTVGQIIRITSLIHPRTNFKSIIPDRSPTVLNHNGAKQMEGRNYIDLTTDKKPTQQPNNQDRTLVTDGVYSWFRHPNFLGIWLEINALSMILAAPLTIIATFCGTWALFYRQIEAEDKKLKEEFGQQYEDYMRQVPAGIPFMEDLDI